ncbi:MAG: hypothetical protein KDD32_01715 [Bacteroidetes bacterium]|nr:hypothetical protein [Bacteroidota bacterium]
MDDILRLLLAENLKNLDGLEFFGNINVPKDLLAESIKDSLIEKKVKEEVESKQQNDSGYSLHPVDYQNFIEHVNINEFNVYFEEDEVCLKFDFRK